MKDTTVTNTIKYIGVDDKTLDLFESQYLIPNGISYNSYLILDEKVAVMDTVDARATEEWLANLREALGERTPDYLIVSHMEPDHAANIEKLATLYPNMNIVGNSKTFGMMKQFFALDTSRREVVVSEGDTLELGTHTLHFIMAPMVHWPEVMVTYEEAEKILFSADGFGKFGTLDTEEDWTCEARRYYFNIVGKYGAQVQGLLRKAAPLDIRMICPLHGPILKDDLSYYIGKYQVWSSYEPEDDGVLVAYASIHGNTKRAAEKMVEILKGAGAPKVAVTDLTRDDMAEAVEDAFRYSKMILMASSYDGGVFPPMEDFLHHLKAKNYQKRKVALVENGTWAPCAAKAMRGIIEEMKFILEVEPHITIRSVMTEENVKQMETMAKEILE